MGDTKLSYAVIGKTLLVRTLAKVLDVPFSVTDATALTQVSDLFRAFVFILTEHYDSGWLCVVALRNFCCFDTKTNL